MTSKEDDANIKLADFGFATEVDGNNCKKQVGTPGYIAPEIIQNQLYGKSISHVSSEIKWTLILQARLWTCGRSE